jgi:hypothetical protein
MRARADDHRSAEPVREIPTKDDVDDPEGLVITSIRAIWEAWRVATKAAALGISRPSTRILTLRLPRRRSCPLESTVTEGRFCSTSTAVRAWASGVSLTT